MFPEHHSVKFTNSTHHVLRQTGQNSLIKELRGGHLHLLFTLMKEEENTKQCEEETQVSFVLQTQGLKTSVNHGTGDLQTQLCYSPRFSWCTCSSSQIKLHHCLYSQRATYVNHSCVRPLTPDRGVFWNSSSFAICISAMETYLCWKTRWELDTRVWQPCCCHSSLHGRIYWMVKTEVNRDVIPALMSLCSHELVWANQQLYLYHCRRRMNTL